MRRTRLPAKLTLQRVVSHRSRCVSTAQAPSSSLREHHGIKVAAATSAAMCVCVVRSQSQSAVDCQERHPNPVWPSGISEKDVNDFVDSVLTDSSINMSGIPDVVERSIYAATVTMTANLLYRAIAELHGIQLFGHELILKRQMSSTGKVVIDGDHFGIDEEILEQVADRLLMNSSVNQTLVPDVVERQLYINCLKLIFHMLDSIAYSLRITFCGHDLRLHFEPSKKPLAPKSSTTRVSSKDLLEVARRAVNPDGVYGDFQVQLLASLYGLVLGLVDDLLANTEIDMLSDKIKIDIVQGITETQQVSPDVRLSKTESARPKKSGTALVFGLGVGVGAAATIAALSLSSRRG
ncbi:hypothetical protein MHU86_22155 [Fragilaria crotonensis]|nr:hypothetical protein MHU86_22155 [Fragilaria crotonensis]